MLRLPELRSEQIVDLDDALSDAAAQDGAEPGALLAAGDFGRLVHRAFEHWARERIRGALLEPASAYVERAAVELRVHPKSAQIRKAIDGMTAAIAALANWRIERTEAPFSLQYGDAIVTGFIDLIARDPANRATIIDFKTGSTAAIEFGLQLGIYRDAAMRVMRLDDVACAIGRFDKSGFSLEPLEVPDATEIQKRIAAAAVGLRSADVTPRPGGWCYDCAYRGAPCDAYPRKENETTLKG
jgi:ATP-dependent exoDNAse (exonuclease V) beta subunit